MYFNQMQAPYMTRVGKSLKRKCPDTLRPSNGSKDHFVLSLSYHFFFLTQVRQMLDEQFQRYLDDVEKAARDCAAAVRRLVNKGPPMYINDAHGLPLPEGETHIAQLWFSVDGSEVSAILKVANSMSVISDSIPNSLVFPLLFRALC
jgi:hypothetical protein